MSKTSILVAAAIAPGAKSPDMNAVFICDEIRRRPFEMTLVEDRIVDPRDVRPLLASIPPSAPCAVVLVGPFEETEELARRCLDQRAHLVVLRVAINGDVVRIAARDPRLKELVDAIQDLVSKDSSQPSQRSYLIQLPAPANEAGLEADAAECDGERSPDETGDEEPLALSPPARLLEAAIEWVHALLWAAAGRLFKTGGESVEFTRVQIVDWLEERDAQTPFMFGNGAVADADAVLTEALDAAGKSSEPLARVVNALGLDSLEFRILVLALGPELDPRYQHWISLLMDDPGRRVGTLGLYADLLGLPSRVACDIARSGRLAKWRLFEDSKGGIPAADAPLRLDSALRAWLLGSPDGLENDPALRRILRNAPWLGARLVHDENRARQLIESIGDSGVWVILAGDGGPAAWRALAEAGARACETPPVRADLSGAASIDPLDSAETGIRLARLARISRRPLLLDASNPDADGASDQALRALFNAIGNAGETTGALIASDPARIVRLLGDQAYRIEKELPSAEARLAALRLAAETASAHFTDEAAESLANLYPLQIDGMEQAMGIALARPLGDGPDAGRARFITACKEVSAEGASGLAQRIEPIFDLADVVLPPDRKGQLEEIVDNIRFAPKVLEGWKFRDQLPYGLGVTALFHGPSGVGKTMGSMAVAKALGVQILRIDLSRVVSKYIGDTEKNIDRVFMEAQLSGAALVIDEADGLLARRGEVKDAHDRYANLEVAYLLQRMEAYEGLAILTTNLRQNLDSAFLRRMRFIVDFPRPDAAAREEIWRRCLPPESHELDNATFRQLGRRIELTGGSIRQITLRAAFLAAAAGEKIGPAHVAHATRAEFAKLGLPPVELDLIEGRAAA